MDGGPSTGLRARGSIVDGSGGGTVDELLLVRPFRSLHAQRRNGFEQGRLRRHA
jgi:hypothetical protein